MSEKINLKALRCPTCGGELMAENESDQIRCIYCGNIVVPVEKSDSEEHASAVRVEGIRTPSSALAYQELFFETYDWDAFTYAQSLSVPEIDALAGSLKYASADDKSTWLFCFRAIEVPLSYKLTGCYQILAAVIAEYKKDNLDAYSKFDAYKRIAGMIASRKISLLAELTRIREKAAKYGATAQEQAALDEKLRSLERATELQAYSDIESIPEIRLHNQETDARIKLQLAAKGIDADVQYTKAKELLQAGKNTEALDLILTLDGYADADKLRQRADKCFSIGDALEVAGKLYYFYRENAGEDQESEKALCLYRTKNGKPEQEPLIRNIRKVVTNYASILYYLTMGGKLKKYDLATGESAVVYPNKLYAKQYYLYDWKGYFFAEVSGEESGRRYALIRVDLRTGATEQLLNDVHKILSVKKNMMVVERQRLLKKDEYDPVYETSTCIFDVESRKLLELGKGSVQIYGFLAGQAIYTRPAPNEKNNNLYAQPVDGTGPERLIEQNIYRFCAIEAGKLFYYVGNSRNHSLITVEGDGSGRTQWPGFISEMLFEQGGWLYFIRRSGYNSALCRSRTDGTGFRVIASGIDSFVALKNGYLYYISRSRELVKVRMDGSNLQTLCEDVEKVLSVQEDKIIFVSQDDRVQLQDQEEQVTYRSVRSIYCVEFTGCGKSKLAYNIREAEEYDDSTVYYMAEKVTADGKRLLLYRLDVETTRARLLLEALPEQVEKRGSAAFTICMVLAAIFAFVGVMGLAAESGGMMVVGFLISILTLCVGFVLKSSKNEE